MNETIDEQNYMLNDLAKGGADEQFPGKVISVTEEGGNRFLFACDNGVLLRVEVITEKVVRFRYATTGSFEDDFSYAVTDQLTGPGAPAPAPDSSLEEESLGYLVRTRELRISLFELIVSLHNLPI